MGIAAAKRDVVKTFALEVADFRAILLVIPSEGSLMFLRRYERCKNGKAHTYWAVCESYRTARGSRQREVAYLGGTEAQRTQRLGAAGPAPGGPATGTAAAVVAVRSAAAGLAARR